MRPIASDRVGMNCWPTITIEETAYPMWSIHCSHNTWGDSINSRAFCGPKRSKNQPNHRYNHLCLQNSDQKYSPSLKSSETVVVELSRNVNEVLFDELFDGFHTVSNFYRSSQFFRFRCHFNFFLIHKSLDSSKGWNIPAANWQCYSI